MFVRLETLISKNQKFQKSVHNFTLDHNPTIIFKILKFAPNRKQFRDSGSASLCEQKCLPYHLSNPQGYRDTTI